MVDEGWLAISPTGGCEGAMGCGQTLECSCATRSKRLPASANLRRAAETISRALSQMLLEECFDSLEGNLVHAVVEVDVVGAGDNQEFLRFGGCREGGFAEVA